MSSVLISSTDLVWRLAVFSARPGLTVGLEPGGGYPILRLRRGEPVILELVDESAMREGGVVEVVLCFLRRLLIPVDGDAVDGEYCVSVEKLSYSSCLMSPLCEKAV